VEDATLATSQLSLLCQKQKSTDLSEPLFSVFFQSCDVGVLAIIKKRI
jgi:hypothetical protein